MVGNKEATVQRSTRKIKRQCWCGAQALTAFSNDYRLCSACGTLVSQGGLPDTGYTVQDDDHDFYGKNYWLDHQAHELGYPQIEERARLDLPERCTYWLRHILSYRLPPANVLELGASHGGFVAMMRWAGFQATGLELSPWIADFARSSFDVPMLVGPLEQQSLEPGTLDIIVAHDVMEHLPDPVATLQTAVKLLKPDGLLMLQMPDFVEGKTYAQRVASQERFLDHVSKSEEHLYLYSKRATRQILARVGLSHVQFCRPIFDYDMYVVAERQAFVARPPSEIAAFLEGSPQGRLVLALLDKGEEHELLSKTWMEAEADRAARLQTMTLLGEQLAESEADRAARLEVILSLSRNLSSSEKDRNACLLAIKQQQRVIQECQATMEAIRRTLNLPSFPSLGVRLREGCTGLSKKVVKMMLPESFRRRLRSGMLAKTKASKGVEITRPGCVVSNRG